MEKRESETRVTMDLPPQEPVSTPSGLTDIETTNVTEVVPALEQITRSEIDVQIATAHRYPRSIKAFHRQALDMITLDEDTAASCFYSLPRGGKTIEGPSARLAEIVFSAWGNMRAQSRIVEETDHFIVAQGVAHDLEKNVARSTEVRRRITDRSGRRYNDDMITVTANAACSIAARNAILQVIPGAYTKELYRKAREVAIGTVETLALRRSKAVDYLGKMGVPLKRIMIALEKPETAGLEDIGLDDLGTLRGLITAIREGDTTVEEAFPASAKSPFSEEKKQEGGDK